MNKLPVGILGGTFDPIHLGHIHLATTIYKSCNLQKILLIPCYQSPLRTPPIASAQDRFNMVQLAIKNLPHLDVDNYEIKHHTISYTNDTLEYLRQKNPSTPLALIMGIDAFNKFDEWHKWQRILELAHLIIANRHNHWQTTNEKIIKILAERQVFTPKQLQEKPAGLIYCIDINPLPIAATEIRTLIKQQKDASLLLAKDVWQYINDNKLYTNQ